MCTNLGVPLDLCLYPKSSKNQKKEELFDCRSSLASKSNPFAKNYQSLLFLFLFLSFFSYSFSLILILGKKVREKFFLRIRVFI